MMANFETIELAWRLWREVYQTYSLVKQCDDQTFGKYGLTTEQYTVLVSISYLEQPVRITDIARWLERSANSISMIIDRMVKAGLVKRARDKVDRRVVYVSKTRKAESLLRPAIVASLESIGKILSPIPNEDRLALLNLLGKVKYETIKSLKPGVSIEEIKKNELKQSANIRKWLSEYGTSSTPEVKRQGGEKKKTRKNTK
jgi:DNA-binding MarR family transcriptional regulator